MESLFPERYESDGCANVATSSRGLEDDRRGSHSRISVCVDDVAFGQPAGPTDQLNLSRAGAQVPSARVQMPRWRR